MHPGAQPPGVERSTGAYAPDPDTARQPDPL